MGQIISGKQWKIVLVGDIPPEWPDDPLHIATMLQSALNFNMLLMQSFKWSNIEISPPGQEFPLPAQPQTPLQ